MWAGVTLATMWKGERLRLALLLGHLLVSLTVATGWLFGRHVSGWWAVAILVAGLGWGVLWPLAVGGLVVLGPPTILVGIAVSAIYVIELAGNVVGALRGKDLELPRPVPYRNHRGRF